MQPVEWDGTGVVRFKANPIVRFLLDHNGKFDLNDLHRMSETAGFGADDWDQFNQLIGYSVSACPLRNKALQERADAETDALLERQPRDPRRKKKSHVR
jgi:hypothetical protein